QALNNHAIVAVTDRDGTITYANDKFCAISGYDRDELLGANHRILNSGIHSKSFFVEMWRTIAAGEVWTGEICNRSKDGALYWVDTTITPIRGADGRIERYVAVRTDVTGLKESEQRLAAYAEDLLAVQDDLEERSRELTVQSEALQAARRAADAASRTKSEFLANMSHEIRTPMTAILGYTELLLDPAQPPDERARAIETIRRNGEHLLALINDILDLSKIEAGRMDLERLSFDPLRVVMDVESLMSARAAEKGIALSVERRTPVPVSITADPTRLRQVLVNLVGNAVKFTGEGGVRIVVSFEPPSTLRFEVLDTGPGMTQEQLDGIFEAFQQADSSVTRKHGGTGLGLAISRRLAESLGGGITVESEPGRGSAFTLAIDTGDVSGVRLLNPDEPIRADDARPDDHEAAVDLSGVRVLLAEDGPDNQRLLSHHLRKAGATVTVVETGADALERAQLARDAGEPYDLVLMDMQMPVMDGYTATRELRARGYTIPVIALTAHAMTSDRAKCLAAGCDDYASKPISRAALLRVCAENLARARAAA
ncbi:MAG: PAS domain-containing hybrid sensor histidine kinase/response regulator, partial [Planctomycetota bacterium]